ncbi:MAG: HAMP domain-containing sensor histidine kinase [Tepidisphaeraceae bacterium]
MRLTLLTVVVFLIIQTAVSVARYVYTERQLDASLRERLAQQAKSLIAKLDKVPDTPSPSAFYQLVEAEPRSILVEELLVSLYTPGGQLLASNCDPPISFINSMAVVAAQVNTPVHNRYQVRALQSPGQDLRPGRTVAVPWKLPSGERRILVVATSDEFVVQLMHEMGWNIWTSVPISLLPVAVAGWLIAGIAVRPIIRLQQVAQVLRPDSLADQIDIGSTASEVAKLQDRLNDARQRLDAGYRAQEQFAANVAHEMKTPLAVVAAHADLVKTEAQNSPALAKFVDLARDETLRLARTCDSLLLLARVRHGKPVTASARSYLVNEWVMDSVQDCVELARLCGVTLVPQLMDGEFVDVSVQGDADLLRIMLDNVLRNAVRFSPIQSTVTISAEAVQSGVRVAVLDHGPGIPADVLNDVFERFVQADAALPQGGRGAGIGLQIARGIADLHGGKLRAANLEEGGCQFTIELPIEGA